MAMIEMRIWVGAIGRSPDVRAFVDLEPACGLGSERELPLEQRTDHEWVGAFSVAASANHFLYRVGIAAAEGADWSLIVRDRTLALDLLSDADSLARSKNWFVGSCLLAQGRVALRSGARPSRVRLRAASRLAQAGPVEPCAVISLDHYRAALGSRNSAAGPSAALHCPAALGARRDLRFEDI